MTESVELLSDEAVDAAYRDAESIGHVTPELRNIFRAERAARKAAEKQRDWWKKQYNDQSILLQKASTDVWTVSGGNVLLREALVETLAIAERNEAGDYIARARAALSPIPEVKE